MTTQDQTLALLPAIAEARERFIEIVDELRDAQIRASISNL
jgi:hypothetical protein